MVWQAINKAYSWLRGKSKYLLWPVVAIGVVAIIRRLLGLVHGQNKSPAPSPVESISEEEAQRMKEAIVDKYEKERISISERADADRDRIKKCL